MERRAFLRGGVLTAATLAFGPDFWRAAYAATAVAGPGPYGPLLPPDANGMQLPAGFRSRVVARTGSAVTPGGYTWHTSPDGGACYATPDGGWIYTSNSETTPGGAGALVFDASGQVTGAHSILTGTRNNCAGGATPWGTWLSCEETSGGQVYECDPTGLTPAVVRPALGSFNHEAVAVDPVRKHLYLTEDAGSGKLYRFRPTAYDDPATRLTDGVLEAAVVDASNHVTWTPVAVPTLPAPNQVPNATSFNGGEGIWYDRDTMYFTTKGDNRVWALDCATQTLEIIYDDASFPAGAPLTGVDNVTVSPFGDIFVAEDGGTQDLVIIGNVDGQRQVTTFMHLTGHGSSEITGPAFTPDGTRLLLSSQRGTTGAGSGGITYLIEPEAGAPGFRRVEPSALVPDVPLPALLPVAAVAAAAGVLAMRSRRDGDGETA